MTLRRVLWLLPGGVAERAGLKVGDIITDWDGMRLTDFSLQVNQ
jgi:S1-C subfamily serine protease